MCKLLIIALSAAVLVSCATPMEMAKETCYQLGDPSSACFERQLNYERTRADIFYKRQRAQIDSLPLPSNSQQPAESEYQRQAREFEDKQKKTCEMTGGVFEKFGTGWTCGKPKTAPPPPLPQKTENPQSSQPDYGHMCGGGPCYQ